MKKIYKYSFNTNHGDPKGIIRQFLSEHKIKYTDELVTVFEIEDAHPYLDEIKNFLTINNINTPEIRLEYSKKELEEAPYLKIWLRKYSGYPQPESINAKKSYKNYTYDVTNFCENCGSGLVQNNSFYLKKSFNIKKLRFGGVYWVYDTFFITNELHDLFVKEGFTGIEFLPVKNIKTKETMDHILQLKINDIFPVKMKYETKKIIDCKVCNQKRDLIRTDSTISFPKEILKYLDKDFYVSQELTGDGFMCCRHVLISNRVYKFLSNNKISNICAEPIFVYEPRKIF